MDRIRKVTRTGCYLDGRLHGPGEVVDVPQEVVAANPDAWTDEGAYVPPQVEAQRKAETAQHVLELDEAKRLQEALVRHKKDQEAYENKCLQAEADRAAKVAAAAKQRLQRGKGEAA